MVHSKLTFKGLFDSGQKAVDEGNLPLAQKQWASCIPLTNKNVHEHRQLAHAFQSIGQLSQAETVVRRALEIAPEDLLLKADIANILLDRGESDQTIALFLGLASQAQMDKKLQLSLSLISNTLMALEYSSNYAPAQKMSVATYWGGIATLWAQTTAQLNGIPALVKKPKPTSAPRVGFISGDLCDHPVGLLLLPLLSHSPKTWVPFIYDNASRKDRTNLQLKQCLPRNHWHDIGPLNDAEAMQLILSDNLDCLFELSGHSGRSRLRLLAHRLAQRQISWLGFSGTTGLPTIDAILMDHSLSNGVADQFSESLLNLNPSRFCFRPPYTPPIQQAPSLTNGFITFGSFNNSAKYSPTLLATWAELLNQVSNSRLLLKWRTFADEPFRDSILRSFASLGIDPQRIELRHFSSHRRMLDEYNEVDIALDTFPFTGGYTSLEALWMGVPIITLKGNTPISRQSASFLEAIGHTEWIAEDAKGYINLAKNLSRNPATLRIHRETLRYKIMNSALYDSARFSESFESVLRTIFK